MDGDQLTSDGGESSPVEGTVASSILYDGFSKSQVIGLGISEPSTVREMMGKPLQNGGFPLINPMKKHHSGYFFRYIGIEKSSLGQINQPP